MLAQSLCTNQTLKASAGQIRDEPRQTEFSQHRKNDIRRQPAALDELIQCGCFVA